MQKWEYFYVDAYKNDVRAINGKSVKHSEKSGVAKVMGKES